MEYVIPILVGAVGLGVGLLVGSAWRFKVIEGTWAGEKATLYQRLKSTQERADSLSASYTQLLETVADRPENIIKVMGEAVQRIIAPYPVNDQSPVLDLSAGDSTSQIPTPDIEDDPWANLPTMPSDELEVTMSPDPPRI